MNYFGQDGNLGWLKLENEKDKEVSPGDEMRRVATVAVASVDCNLACGRRASRDQSSSPARLKASASLPSRSLTVSFWLAYQLTFVARLRLTSPLTIRPSQAPPTLT